MLGPSFFWKSQVSPFKVIVILGIKHILIGKGKILRLQYKW
jgi:hypothetical protein